MKANSIMPANLIILINQYQFITNIAVGAVGGLVSGWLFTKYKINKQLEANLKEFELKSEKQHNTTITEEKLRKELEKNNQTLNTILTNYSATRNIIYTKQVNAISTIWETMTSIKATIPTPIPLSLSILSDNEFNYAIISKSTIPAMLNHELVTQYILELNNKANKIKILRPFIDIGIYNLWGAYLSVISKIAWQFSDGIHLKNIKSWRKDNYIKSSLSQVLTKEELDKIYSIERGGFDLLTETLELTMLNKIQQNINNNEAVIDVAKQVNIFQNLQQNMASGKEQLGL